MNLIYLIIITHIKKKYGIVKSKNLIIHDRNSSRSEIPRSQRDRNKGRFSITRKDSEIFLRCSPSAESKRERRRNRSSAISQILFASRCLVRTTGRVCARDWWGKLEEAVTKGWRKGNARARGGRAPSSSTV